MAWIGSNWPLAIEANNLLTKSPTVVTMSDRLCTTIQDEFCLSLNGFALEKYAGSCAKRLMKILVSM